MTNYAGAEQFGSNLGLRPCDKVLILSDKIDAYGVTLASLAEILRLSGARVDIEFSLPSRLEADIPPSLHQRLIGSDVIVLCASQSWYQAPLRRRLKHEYKKRIVESYDLRKEMLVSGALCADPAALESLNRKIMSAIGKKKRLRVRTQDGTDISAVVREAGAESGDYRLPGSGGNLPAGEIWMSLEDASVSGQISFNVSFDTLGQVSSGDVVLECSGGRVTRVAGNRGAALSALIKEYPSLVHVAEISIGTNPLAVQGRNVLEDEKKLGMIHCGFGNDTYFGGMSAGPHLDGVISGAMVEVDGTPLMRAGILAI